MDFWGDADQVYYNDDWIYPTYSDDLGPSDFSMPSSDPNWFSTFGNNLLTQAQANPLGSLSALVGGGSALAGLLSSSSSDPTTQQKAFMEMMDALARSNTGVDLSRNAMLQNAYASGVPQNLFNQYLGIAGQQAGLQSGLTGMASSYLPELDGLMRQELGLRSGALNNISQMLGQDAGFGGSGGSFGGSTGGANLSQLGSLLDQYGSDADLQRIIGVGTNKGGYADAGWSAPSETIRGQLMADNVGMNANDAMALSRYLARLNPNQASSLYTSLGNDTFDADQFARSGGSSYTGGDSAGGVGGSSDAYFSGPFADENAVRMRSNELLMNELDDPFKASEYVQTQYAEAKRAFDDQMRRELGPGFLTSDAYRNGLRNFEIQWQKTQDDDAYGRRAQRVNMYNSTSLPRMDFLGQERQRQFGRNVVAASDLQKTPQTLQALAGLGMAGAPSSSGMYSTLMAGNAPAVAASGLSGANSLYAGANTADSQAKKDLLTFGGTALGYGLNSFRPKNPYLGY
jgi:hypothetical protein